MKEKHPIQHLINSELEWFLCNCGNNKFYIMREYLMRGEEHLGAVEIHFTCECGEGYIWEFGDIRKISESESE